MNLFELFFTRNVPADLRFGNFTVSHALLLLASALFVLLISVCAKRAKDSPREKLLVFFTWALPCIYISRFAGFYLLDVYIEPQMSFLDRLPFHLCTLNAIIMPVGVLSKNKPLLNYMYAISLPAAVAAMLMPAMGYYDQYYYLSWQVVFFFIDHSVMALIPILAVICGRFRPQRKYLPHVAALFLPYTASVYIANKLLNENWLFLNYPAEGTVIALFAKYLGNPGYIAALAALAVVIVFFMYLPWRSPSKAA